MNNETPSIVFEDYTPVHAPWLLALSAANQVETGYLDHATLTRMTNAAFIARVAQPALGYLITFDPSAIYESPNFQWFVARMTDFIYVDRIVVAREARGRGIGRQFYEDLFVTAKSAGYKWVTCEVNSDPPNPVSDKFHAALGFVAVGQATLANGKSVCYMSRLL
jgi:uncharacterized protein